MCLHGPALVEALRHGRCSLCLTSSNKHQFTEEGTMAFVRQVVETTYRIELTNLHMGSPPSKQIIADIVSAIQGIVT
jgi:hypothetical protein